MSLTEKEYVNKLGLVCPNCQSGNMESIDSVRVDMGCATQPYMCNVCNATWDDQYTLDGYDNLQVKEVEEEQWQRTP